MRNFQMLIISAVKISQQCLQTASASGGLRPTEISPLDPTGIPSDLLRHILPYGNSWRGNIGFEGFYRATVCNATVLLSQFCPSVHLSVCLSVRRVYCDKTK